MSTDDIKAAAHRLIDTLPPGATWGDLVRVLGDYAAIHAGIADMGAGRFVTLDDLLNEFGISSDEPPH